MEKKALTLSNSWRKAAKFTPLNSRSKAPRTNLTGQHLTGWTFMVFIAGDNNLDPAALRDIAEMAKVGSSDDLHPVKYLSSVNFVAPCGVREWIINRSDSAGIDFTG
jgi:L-aminopeptidase/D-esterase-like protein